LSREPFRILALSGGGVRGIFQAVYLCRLAEALGTPLADHFELIAGTSTGALLGVAIALRIDPNRVVDFYRREASAVFSRRHFSQFRRGPRYDPLRLRSSVTALFQNRPLSDCRPPVIVPAASLERFSHRLFSTLGGPAESDGRFLARDVVMASAAAPTFFEPVKPDGQERTYVDGGLWANSPALAAVLTAHHQRRIPFDQMRVLAVGNGTFEKGLSSSAFTDLRPLSYRTVDALFEIMFATQESFADEFVMNLLPAGNVVRANTSLDAAIPLDASVSALDVLPQLAELTFDRTKQSALDLIAAPHAVHRREQHFESRPADFVSKQLVEAAGLSAFYPSRAYYSERRGASSVDRYIATARRSLFMVSINLMTGVPFDGMLDVLEKKLEARDNPFEAVISLLNPAREPLMHALAPVLDVSADELARAARETVHRLLRFRRLLSAVAQPRLSLRLHNAIPFGSAIMLDRGEPDGRIQIETKAYKTPVRKSFAFEVMRVSGDDTLYDTLCAAYEKLVADGGEMTDCE
jgi:predicted acylesterase/phospholipase RssA